MNIRITRLREDIPLPSYATDGSVAFDLASSEAMTIDPKSLVFAPTGLIIATPPGYALIIAARSSLYKKKGLVLRNGIGVIDQDFCGKDDELKIFLYNNTDAPVQIEKGERLAQGFFVPILKAEWEEGPAQEQSRGGWGSTGGYQSK